LADWQLTNSSTTCLLREYWQRESNYLCTYPDRRPPSTGTAIKSTKSIRALPKIGKIWSWNGDCRLTTSPGTTSQCCKITIMEQKETSRALNSDGASLLKFIMSNKSSLTLGKSYSSSQVGVHLAACGDRSQSVRIGPQDGADGDRLRLLATHLQRHSLVGST
jgi:hypothetical protein